MTWPLLRPALANAFLLGFVESLADFGNPIVLAGNFEVLSTKIFFAIAGAQHDPGRAAVLASVLLGFTIVAFWLQQRWLGKLSYVTVSGKGDGGIAGATAARPVVHVLRHRRRLDPVHGRLLRRHPDRRLREGHRPRRHDAVAVAFRRRLRHRLGRARRRCSPARHGTASSTRSRSPPISAPLTAIIGLLAAYVITRHRFAGRRSFEFLTMVSFAIPGTVIGVSYIVAFNVPPLELTGGMLILVLCFVFRNMPVGVRAGIAALAQIDKTLDEASATLRGSTVRTLREVVVPLLRPAILATLVFSFTHAMTAVSAIIFLATAKYNLATVYIINRVEAGEYPLAIAYSTVLIFFMLAVLLAVQWTIGEARLGRRPANLIATGN